MRLAGRRILDEKRAALFAGLLAHMPGGGSLGATQEATRRSEELGR